MAKELKYLKLVSCVDLGPRNIVLGSRISMEAVPESGSLRLLEETKKNPFVEHFGAYPIDILARQIKI